MAATTDTIAAEVRRFCRKMATSDIPALMEARCAWLLESQVDNFVLAAEGAVYDAGVIISDDPDLQLPQDSTTRLFTTLESFQNQNVVMAIDFKSFFPHPEMWWKGPLYTFTLGAGYTQRDCALFIFQTAAAPHLVAVVPGSFIFGLETDRRPVFWIREIPDYGQTYEYFPIELSPFVMKIQNLGIAVRQTVDSYRKGLDDWCNPESGIVVPNCLRRTLLPVDILKPSSGSGINDLPVERNIWRAFNAHSTKYHIERLMIKPGVGDFQIISQKDQSRAIVELKRGQFRDGWGGKIGHESYKKYKDGVKGLFSLLDTYDVFLSLTFNSSKAILTGRDDLPDELFNVNLKPGPSETYWFDNHDFRQKNILDWAVEPNQRHIAAAEVILDRLATRPTGLRTVTALPFPIEVRQAQVGTSDDSHAPPQNSRKRATTRGMARQRSQLQYEALQEYSIVQQCKTESFGAIHRLGFHPTSTHWFIPGVFPADSFTSFHDLPKQALGIPINFAPIETIDLQAGSDARRESLFYHSTHGLRPSLYVLKPESKFIPGDITPNVYLVPSTEIGRNIWRQERNEAQLNDRMPKKRRERSYLPITGTRLLESYAVPKQHLVLELNRLLRNAANKGRRPPARTYTEIDVSDLLVTKQELMQQIVLMATGETLWGHRLRQILQKDNDADENAYHNSTDQNE